jgi:hypothetical protein
MQQTDTRKRIDALEKERKRIKISIDKLKEKLSKRRVNLPLPQERTNDFESR